MFGVHHRTYRCTHESQITVMKTFEKWRRTLTKRLRFKPRNSSSEPCPTILALEMINGQKSVACSDCLTQLYVPTSTSLMQPRFRCTCGAVLIDPEFYVGRDRTESSGSTSTITLSPRQEDDADYESKVNNTNETDEGRTEQAINDAHEDWGILVTRSPAHNGSMREQEQMEEKEEQENKEEQEEQEEEWVFVAVAEAVPGLIKTDQTMDEPSPKSLPDSPVHIPRAPPGETWVDEHHFPSDDDEDDDS